MVKARPMSEKEAKSSRKKASRRGTGRKKGEPRLPVPSRLSKTRGIRGISLRAETVATYCQFVADKCSWMAWGPADLAGASGIGYETCWRHISAQVKEPRLTTCVAIMQALNVDTKLLEAPK